jgi:hypothetical protein
MSLEVIRLYFRVQFGLLSQPDIFSAQQRKRVLDIDRADRPGARFAPKSVE